jgi:hypothetical protein
MEGRLHGQRGRVRIYTAVGGGAVELIFQVDGELATQPILNIMVCGR